jgi:hypothetical protein
MEISGRVFHINLLNPKVVQVVIKKKVRGKTTPIAFAVLGFWKDKVLNELKLKKNDKIRGRLELKSKLYNGKYYTDVVLYDIELVPEKPKDEKETDQMDLDLPNNYIVDEETGEILL